MENKLFENDVIGRKEFCTTLTERVLQQVETTKNESYTMSINGTYGTGKTSVLKGWEKLLKDEYSNRCDVKYLDIWEGEYHNDPFVVFGHAILRLFSNDRYISKQFKELGKYRVSSAGLSLGIPCIPISFNIALKKQDPFTSYKKSQNLINNIKESIKNKINIEETKKPLILLVDELDRVKPTYALQVLEVMKHIFDIEGLVLIFAVNKEQIKNSIMHEYGLKTDFNGYYRRFFKYQVELPTHAEKYLELIKQNIKADNIDGTGKDILAGLMSGASSYFSIRDVKNCCEGIDYFFKNIHKKDIGMYKDIAMFSYLLFFMKDNDKSEDKDKPDIKKLLENTRGIFNSSPKSDLPEQVIQEFEKLITPILVGTAKLFNKNRCAAHIVNRINRCSIDKYLKQVAISDSELEVISYYKKLNTKVQNHFDIHVSDLPPLGINETNFKHADISKMFDDLFEQKRPSLS